jgi:hypothetical protein
MTMTAALIGIAVLALLAVVVGEPAISVAGDT